MVEVDLGGGGLGGDEGEGVGGGAGACEDDAGVGGYLVGDEPGGEEEAVVGIAG